MRVMRQSRRRALLGLGALILTISSIWLPNVEARFSASGIGCNSNDSFAQIIQAAQSGDLLVPLEPDSSLGPTTVITQTALTIQGNWQYTGQTFPPASCDSTGGTNAPPPNFSQTTTRQIFNGATSGASVGDGPLLTVAASAHTLAIQQLELSGGWSASNGGLLVGNPLQGQAQVLLQDLTLGSGKSNGSGGAIAMVVRGQSSLTMTGDSCSSLPCLSQITASQAGAAFSSGVAPDGGGLFLDVGEGSHVLLQNTEIGNNSTPGSGGGFTIIVRGGSTVVLSHNYIHDNQALGQDSGQNPDPRNGGGGRILIYDGSVEIVGNTFVNNQAPNGKGGGLSIEKVGSSGTAVVSIDSTNVFTSNTAGLGNNDLFLSPGLQTPGGYLPVVLN